MLQLWIMDIIKIVQHFFPHEPLVSKRSFLLIPNTVTGCKKNALYASLIVSFCFSSHTQLVVWVMRTSTSLLSPPRTCQTTWCPPTSHTIPPLDRTTLWSLRPAPLHTTSTSCRAWTCPACPVAKMELLCWTKMAARSAQTAARWPAHYLW